MFSNRPSGLTSDDMPLYIFAALWFTGELREGVGEGEGDRLDRVDRRLRCAERLTWKIRLIGALRLGTQVHIMPTQAST